MRPDMLLHVILSGKRLVADRTMHTLLARMLLAMPCCMPRGGECGRTIVTCGVWTRVFVLANASLGTCGGFGCGGGGGGEGGDGRSRRRVFGGTDGRRRGRVCGSSAANMLGWCSRGSRREVGVGGRGRIRLEVGAIAASGIIVGAHGRSRRRNAGRFSDWVEGRGGMVSDQPRARTDGKRRMVVIVEDRDKVGPRSHDHDVW